MPDMVMALDTVATRLGDSRAWHYKDKQINFASMTEEQIAQEIGLAHQVYLEQWQRPDGTPVDGHYGLFSSILPPNVILQDVGEKFRPVQPPEFVHYGMGVIEALNAVMVSGGTLKNTRHGFICAQLPAFDIDLGGGDKIQKYISFNISWDGTYPITAMLWDLRQVCWNTTPSLEAVDRAGLNRLYYQKRHGLLNGAAIKATADAFNSLVATKRQQAQDVLGKLTATEYDTVNPQTLLKFAAVMADGKAVLDRIVNYTEVNREASFLDRCVNATIDAQAWAAVRTQGMSNKANRVVAEALNGIGQDMSTARGTLWGVLNGYTYWTDHLAGRDEETRQEDVLFGGFTQDKSNAVLLLSAIANTPATLG